MTIADVLAVLAGLTLLAGGFQALVILGTLTFPNVTERAGRHVGDAPVTTALIGLAALIACLVSSAVVANALAIGGKLVGLLVLLGGLTLMVMGAGGMVRRLAGKLGAEPERPFNRLAAATALVELAVLVPLVGWFVVLPAALVLSLGAGLRAVVQGRKSTVPIQPVPVMAISRQPLSLE